MQLSEKTEKVTFCCSIYFGENSSSVAGIVCGKAIGPILYLILIIIYTGIVIWSVPSKKNC